MKKRRALPCGCPRSIAHSESVEEILFCNCTPQTQTTGDWDDAMTIYINICKARMPNG